MFSMLPSTPVKPQPSPASPRMQGTLCKWTNYMSGWQQRWFVLDGGTLAYYLASTEVNQGCRGSFKVTSCDIHVHPTDHMRFDIVMPGGRQVLYLKASSKVERQQWVVALGTSKQEEEGNIGKLYVRSGGCNRIHWCTLDSNVALKGSLPFPLLKVPGPSVDQQVAVKSKMAELQVSCQLLFSQVSNMKMAVSSGSPDPENMQQVAVMIGHTCDRFLKILSECMLLSTASMTGFKGGAVGMVPATPTDHSSPTSFFAPMKLLAGLPHIPPNQSHSLPAILPFPFSFPPFTTQQGKKEDASPKSNDQVTQSLPVHAVGKSSPSALSPESTDGGKRLQGRGSPRNELLAETEKSPVSSSRSHSRANSEAFVTPVSTPTGSPPPSPPPTPHRHTPSSSQEAHTPRSPQAPTELAHTHPTATTPRRIGDRFPQSVLSSDHASFFSRAPHKFEDLVLSDDEGISTLDFLNSCRAVVPFFDTLSSTAFAPVKADINGNIEKLSQRYQSSPERFPTLQLLVVHELETNTHEARNSATDALLWLKRAMEFVQDFMAEVAGGEHSLDIAAGKAYTKSLRRYHNWIVRGMFSMAVRAVPYHKDFLALLGSDGTAEGNAAITVHMADFARSLGEINNIINQFYQSHGLDTSPLL